jgi:hypothetical protein
MRGALAFASLLAVACGGQPIGSKLPRPNTAVVAGTAAAIAGAATLANPNSAGRKPEAPSTGVERRTVATEPMPADVLDRLEDAEERGEVRAQRAPISEPDASAAFPLPAAPAVPRPQPQP